MKYILLVLLLSPFILLKAEGGGSFIIKGEVRNSQETSWDFRLSSFLSFARHDVVLDKKGRFKKMVAVEGMQNMFIVFNDRFYQFYIQPGDTLMLRWDAARPAQTIEVSSPSLRRNNDLQLNLLLSGKSDEDYQLMRRVSDMEHRYKPIPLAPFLGLAAVVNGTNAERQRHSLYDSILLLLNNAYNQRVRIIYEYAKASNNFHNLKKFMGECYYFHLGMIPHAQNGEYNLFFIPDKDLSEMEYMNMQLPQPRAYRFLDVDLFYMSPTYRSFLRDYVRIKPGLRETLSGYVGMNLDTTHGEKDWPAYTKTDYYAYQGTKQRMVAGTGGPPPPSFVMKEYQNGVAEISVPAVLDWYVAQLVEMNAYSYESTEEMVRLHMPRFAVPAFRDAVMATLANRKRFTAGQPAPHFSLKDAAGKPVPLTDFRGKVVILDIWGVHCGPCLSGFKYSAPKLREKYKDKDVVFVNICIEGSREEWKEVLKKYDVQGVNLITATETDGLFTKTYNVSAVPNYSLIDQNGNFVEYNIGNPSNLLVDGRIERLLKTKK